MVRKKTQEYPLSFSEAFALLFFAVVIAVSIIYSEDKTMQPQVLDPARRYPDEVGELREVSAFCDGLCYIKKGEISVIFGDQAKKEAALALIRRHGYRTASPDIWSVKSTVVAVPKGKEGEAIARLQSEPLVRFAGYNYIRSISSNSNY